MALRQNAGPLEWVSGDAAGARAARPRVRLLGGFALTCGNASIALPLAARRVVAFLALLRRPLSRTYVAGSLWLDASESRSHASLRSCLWRLNRAGHPIVDAATDTLSLSTGVAVDVDDMVTRAGALLGHPGCDGAPELNHQVFLDDLLPDWYEDWVLVERERLRQLRLHALEALAERLLVMGRLSQAIEVAQAAVRAEPLRESAHRCLIQVYLSEGNASEACRQYAIYRALLARELGLEPSDKIKSLLPPSA
jgi:DNA-binding SARP family transcriptional activator